LGKDKRRIEIATGTSGIANNFIDIAFDKGQSLNIHGFRADMAFEPENQDANCNGVWAVWVLPGGVIQNADLPANLGSFGDEDFAPYLWGMGVFAATNQTPFHHTFAPKTSRNMQAGGRVVLHILFAGVSGGLVRHNDLITCFTKAIS